MSGEAAKTGKGPTAIIAMDQYFPEEERMYTDHLAIRILPFETRFFVKLTKNRRIRKKLYNASEKFVPGIWALVGCRKLYIDEKITEKMEDLDGGMVNLGAGFDTRAYRLPALSDVSVWEVDQPVNIDAKRSRLEKVLGSIPENVKLISVNFDTEDMAEKLKEQGYSFEKKTFFVFEAVTQYLTEEGIRATFEKLGNAASGSCVVFTYVLKDFITGENMYSSERAYRKLVESDPPVWLFGMLPEEWPGFLSEYGWKVVEDLGCKELYDRYLAKTGRDLETTELERIVYAEKE